MKKFNLWDKNRFKIWENERKQFLKGLSFKKSASILEALTSEEALKPFKNNFPTNRPLCLKIGLRKRENGVIA